jgi:hypothetical protein
VISRETSYRNLEFHDKTTDEETEPESTTQAFFDANLGMAPSTNPKEVKIRTPTEFHGDKEKATQFIRDIQLYLHINAHIYDTDEKKIIFTLSFMTDRAAAAWKEAFITDKTQKGGGFTFGAWDTFLKVFKEGFEPIDAAGHAHLKLKTLKQGDRPAEDYISDFCIFASKSGISSDKALREYFIDGLNPKLLERSTIWKRSQSRSLTGLLLLPNLMGNGVASEPSSAKSEKKFWSTIWTTLLPRTCTHPLEDQMQWK